jgi:hypothetical protein
MLMIRLCFLVVGGLVVGSLPSHAQEADPCSSQLDSQRKAASDYEKATNDFDEETPNDNKPQACVGGVFRWERTDFSIDIPEFKTARTSWKMNVPVTWIENKEVIIKEPILKCEDKKVGQIPEPRCDDTWIITKIPLDGEFKTKGIPKCITTWSDITAKLCWPETRDKRVVMGIPQFEMELREMSVDVPQVTTRTKKMSLHLPRFYIESGCVGSDCAQKCKKEMETQADKVNSERSATLGSAKMDLLVATSEMFQCHRDGLDSQEQAVSESFDKYISVAEVNLQAMKAQGLTEVAAQQERALSEMQANKAEALKQIHAAREHVMAAQKDALAKLE